MKVKNLINKISSASRSKDWRLSFVPFTMGCVYLWFNWLNLAFSFYHFIILILSIITTFGFAALGYFINEFFDQKEDFKAGKINKLSLLSSFQKALLFFSILLITFLPWIYLPKDDKSYYLISLEILCFLLYSLPLLRYKENIFLAGILDASYAYLVPSLLSFHTFLLISNSTNQKEYLLLFFVLLFFIGYRNILIHQVNDAISDKKAGLTTLAHYLGPQKSNNFLKILYVIELALLISSAIALCAIKVYFGIWFIVILIYLYKTKQHWLKVFSNEKFTILKEERHFIDLLYQIWFPISQLVILLLIDWRWFLIFIIHAFAFINRAYLEKFWQYFWHKLMRPILSFIVNYIIYIIFRIGGVNLKKEEKSAIEIIKSKFKSN